MNRYKDVDLKKGNKIHDALFKSINDINKRLKDFFKTLNTLLKLKVFKLNSDIVGFFEASLCLD